MVRTPLICVQMVCCLLTRVGATHAIGFCEVKASAAESHHADTHLDTLRTAVFCKAALDLGHVKCTLGVQVVGRFQKFTSADCFLPYFEGFHVHVYLCCLESEALFPFLHQCREV